MSIQIASPKNDFQAASIALDNAANALDQASKDSLSAAGKSLKRAGADGVKAAVDAGGAAANAVFALGHTGAAALATLDAVASDAEAALRAGSGVAIGAVATGGWALEGAATGARFAFINIAKAFLALANAMNRVLGDAPSEFVVKALGDPNAKRLSERLFDASGKQFKLSAEALAYSWDSYVDAAKQLGKAGGNVAGSLVNVGYFTMHMGALAGNLGLAALEAGAPITLKLAELGVRVAQVGVEAAEKGVEGARDLALLGAEINAAVGNALAHPDQKQYGITEAKVAQFQARLESIKAAA